MGIFYPWPHQHSIYSSFIQQCTSSCCWLILQCMDMTSFVYTFTSLGHLWIRPKLYVRTQI
jgi:hypothetical protein